MAVDPAAEYRIAAVLPLGSVHDRRRGQLDLWDRVPRALQRDHRRDLPQQGSADDRQACPVRQVLEARGVRPRQVRGSD